MDKKIGRLIKPNTGIFIVIMCCFSAAALAFQQYILAGAELVLTAVSGLCYLVWFNRRRAKLQAFLHTAMEETAGNARLPFPQLLVRLGDEGIVYANDEFISLTGFSDMTSERLLPDVIPGLSVDWLISGKRECPYDIALKDRRYRVYGAMMQADDRDQTKLGILYFTDLTELYLVRDEYIRSRPVVSVILIDNYDELTKNLTEGAMSALNARLNDAINSWTENYHGLLRRLEKNRYLFIFERRDLSQAIAEKFSILESIHEITSPAGLNASISFGLGVDGETFEEAYNFASLAIEMALSRGGDQAVIKDRLNFNFYGGRKKETEHRSKVRSRVTATSLTALISQCSRVFIMGHKNADLDSVGAAMGVHCLCRKLEKPSYIVLDLENNAADRLIEEIRALPTHKDLFISGQEALLLSDSHSALVVVDTNRPDQVECMPLLDAIPKTCVIDHHRRAADYIKSVVVNLHEPFASSASELVTEVLQYAVEKKDVAPIEAKALMAGIFLDTKSFNVRTGERTFEAAAFLRQLGADTVEVKMLLQTDFQNTMEKYQIIKSAKLYRQELAIAALNTATSRVLAAQAADELLNISGITASFVLYPDGDRVIISARSIGSANVQVILEPLGGGGNTATAGAQVKNCTIREALDRLVTSIDKFYEDQ